MNRQCNVCGSKEHEERSITHLFETPQGEKVVINHIPAIVCERCGEITFSLATSQHIGEIVRAVSQKTIRASGTLPLYEYDEPETLVNA